MRFARDILPCSNTISNQINTQLQKAEIKLQTVIEMFKKHGGGITMDFAKKRVDYLAITAHFIDDKW